MINVIKSFIFSFLLLLTIFRIWFFVPTYRYTYLESLDGKTIITSLNYDGQTYITYGRYDNHEIPENYVKPRYRGINSGFEAILSFNGDTAVLYARYGKFDSIGVNRKIKIKVFGGPGVDPLFQQMLDGKSGRYQLLHD